MIAVGSALAEPREPEVAPDSTAPPAPLLSLVGIGKRFGALKALDDVSLNISPGEIHCLLGENGAGKSTLCNLIFGTYRPDGGHMTWLGRPHRPTGPAAALADGIAMVHQHFSLVPDLSVVDNLLLGQSSGVLRRRDHAARIASLSETYGLSVDPYASIGRLSVGERQRVEIVKCLMREPRLMVLDEPTAVLLPGEIDELLRVCQKLAQRGCSVVLVTHKLAEVKQVADRVTVLRAGRTVAQSDAPARDLRALVHAMIQRDLAGLDAGASAMLGQAPDPVLAAPPQSADPTNDGAPLARSPTEVLQVDGLTVRDAAQVTRLENFTLIVNRGEIVGVAGVEGNGQSELAAVLSGMSRATSGRFFVDGQDMTAQSPEVLRRAGVGVIPEDRHAVACVPAMSVTENLMLNRLGDWRRFGLLDRRAMNEAAQTLMTRFDVRAAGPQAAFATLSGGNQQKAVLARELTTEGLSLLLAAQPTRGLDVGAVESIYRQIRAACASGVGVLLISSELDELLSVAHRIVVMYRGRLVGHCKAEPAARARIGAMMAGQAA